MSLQGCRFLEVLERGVHKYVLKHCLILDKLLHLGDLKQYLFFLTYIRIVEYTVYCKYIHAGYWNSFWAHANADLTRLFIRVAPIIFMPTSQDGWLQVTVSNATTLTSLMAHTGNNIDRVTGQPPHPLLSTIKQDLIFYINVLQ